MMYIVAICSSGGPPSALFMLLIVRSRFRLYCSLAVFHETGHLNLPFHSLGVNFVRLFVALAITQRVEAVNARCRLDK